MIPKECKRLAEVDFPIAEVSRHSATCLSQILPTNSAEELKWEYRQSGEVR